MWDVDGAVLWCAASHWPLGTGKEAAMGPLREVSPSALVRISPAQLRPIKLDDFAAALSVIKPSCNREMLKVYEDFTRDFGTQA